MRERMQQPGTVGTVGNGKGRGEKGGTAAGGTGRRAQLATSRRGLVGLVGGQLEAERRGGGVGRLLTIVARWQLTH